MKAKLFVRGEICFEYSDDSELEWLLEKAQNQTLTIVDATDCKTLDNVVFDNLIIEEPYKIDGSTIEIINDDDELIFINDLL